MSYLLLYLHPPEALCFDRQMQRQLIYCAVESYKLVAQEPKLVKVDDGMVLTLGI